MGSGEWTASPPAQAEREEGEERDRDTSPQASLLQLQLLSSHSAEHAVAPEVDREDVAPALNEPWTAVSHGGGITQASAEEACPSPRSMSRGPSLGHPSSAAAIRRTMRRQQDVAGLLVERWREAVAATPPMSTAAAEHTMMEGGPMHATRGGGSRCS